MLFSSFFFSLLPRTAAKAKEKKYIYRIESRQESNTSLSLCVFVKLLGRHL